MYWNYWNLVDFIEISLMKTMSTIGQSACMCLLHWNLICQTTWHWLHCCLPSSGTKPSSSSIKSTLGTPLLSLPLTRGASAILNSSFCIKYSRTIEEQPEERGLRMYSWYAGIGIWLELQVDTSTTRNMSTYDHHYWSLKGHKFPFMTFLWPKIEGQKLPVVNWL